MTNPPGYSVETTPESVLVDSNLLLLWIVGLLNPAMILTHKRLADFTVDDFRLLTDYLAKFPKILTTPHILTEVSNLAGSASGAFRRAIMDQLGATVTILEEVSAAAADLLLTPEAGIFGLTDAAITQLATNTVVFTQDGRLAFYLRRSNLSAVTLGELRQLSGTKVRRS